MNGVKEAGKELQQRREELGLSLDDAYIRTRIATAYLRALEEGDLSALPAPCYAGGFVRTYCATLELEPERYVDCYRAATRPAVGKRPRRTARRASIAYSIPTPHFVLPAWTGQAVTWAVICGIVALSWVTYSIVFKPSTDPEANRAQASTLDMVVPEAPVESNAGF